MARIAAPLRAMGANIQTAPGGVLPVVVKRARAPLAGIRHDLPVASAQIKSAILLAALGARGETTIREPAPSRDHTERMLGAFGIDVRRAGATVSVVGGGKLRAAKIAAPADISSAMFFVVLAAIAPAAEVILREVGINPTRAGALAILRRMGARIEIENERQLGGEPVADIRVRAGARLRGVEIGADETPAAIDEFPAIFIAAACAAGETRLTGAGELRLKESDRIAAMAAGLRALQIDARPSADGIRIRGAGGAVDSRPVFAGGAVDSCGDHRVAMSFAVAAARAAAPIEIADCANVATSFPDFVAQARAVGLDARAVDSESRPLTPRPEPQLPPRLESKHRGRVRQIDAARSRPHRQAQNVGGRETREKIGVQAARFAPEKNRVAATITRLVVAPPAAGRSREQSSIPQRAQARFDVAVFRSPPIRGNPSPRAAVSRRRARSRAARPDAVSRPCWRPAESRCRCWARFRAARKSNAKTRPLFARLRGCGRRACRL